MTYHPDTAANMFGSRRFWAFAVIVSVAWGAVMYFNDANEKADNAKESARIDLIATEQAAKDKCAAWMQRLYGGPGYKLVSLRTVSHSTQYRTYGIDTVVQRQAPLDKKLFQTNEHCQMKWSYRDDEWEVRVR